MIPRRKTPVVRYSLYLRIAMRRKRSCRSKREQATQTARCSRNANRCQDDRLASCCRETSLEASLQEIMWPSALRIISRTGSSSLGLRAPGREPVAFEAFAQRHPGPIEDDPQVIRRNGQFLTD